jgi:hypothetical protein
VLKTLAKGYAYTHRPQLTFAALHPKEAAHLKKMEWDMRHAYAPRLAGAIALTVALPLGIWIGRRWERVAAAKREARARGRADVVRRAAARRAEPPRPPRAPSPPPSPRPPRAPRPAASLAETTAPGELRR